MSWYRTVEIGGPATILAVDFLNPSYTPLRCRVLGLKPDVVLQEYIAGPYHVPPALALGPTIPYAGWAIDFVNSGLNGLKVPQKKQIAIEIVDPPPFTKTVVLMPGGIVFDSEVPHATERSTTA